MCKYQLFPSNIIKVIKYRRLRWAGHVARMEEGRNSLEIVIGEPMEKRSLGWPRQRWVDNIRMYLK